MSGDHGTPSSGASLRVEPSQPTASRGAGRAFSSEGAPPPRPWLPTDNFIYGHRYRIGFERALSRGEALLENVLREDNLARRLLFQYGANRTSNILADYDHATAFDVAAWRSLGA